MLSPHPDRTVKSNPEHVHVAGASSDLPTPLISANLISAKAIPVLAFENAPSASSFLDTDSSAVSDTRRTLRILTGHLDEKNFCEVVAADRQRKFELEREGSTGNLIHVLASDWKPLVERFTESFELTFRNGQPQGGIDYHAPFKRGRNELPIQLWLTTLAELEEILSKAPHMASDAALGSTGTSSAGEVQGMSSEAVAFSKEPVRSSGSSPRRNFVSRSIGRLFSGRLGNRNKKRLVSPQNPHP